jgi:hypothetical protein
VEDVVLEKESLIDYYSRQARIALARTLNPISLLIIAGITILPNYS